LGRELRSARRTTPLEADDARAIIDRPTLAGGPASIAIVRIFDAPRERFWKEWPEPERFAAWFGGPECEVPPLSVFIDLKTRWRVASDHALLADITVVVGAVPQNNGNGLILPSTVSTW
jgi:hypothetical protein